MENDQLREYRFLHFQQQKLQHSRTCFGTGGLYLAWWVCVGSTHIDNRVVCTLSALAVPTSIGPPLRSKRPTNPYETRAF